MSKKKKFRNTQRDGEGSRPSQPAEAVLDRGPPPRRVSPLKVGVALGVVVLGTAALLGAAFRGRDAATISGGTLSTRQPAGAPVTPDAKGAVAPTASSTAAPAAAELPPPPPGTRVPLNDVDPVTGKPITPNSPTLTYKGYTIAFCCGSSGGYNGGWARMSESEKETFVRRYVKP